mgnify:CR=1 FL=1
MPNSTQTIAVLSDRNCRSAVRFDGDDAVSTDVCLSYRQLTKCCNTSQSGAVDVKSETKRVPQPIKVEFIRVASEVGAEDTWIACINGRRTTLESNRLYLPDAVAGIAQAEMGGLEKNCCPSVVYSVRIEEGAQSMTTVSLRVELRHESTDSSEDNIDTELVQESDILPYTTTSISASCTVAPYPFLRSNCHVGALINRLALDQKTNFDSNEFNTQFTMNAKLAFSETSKFVHELKGNTVFDLGMQFTKALIDGTFGTANANRHGGSRRKSGSKDDVRSPKDPVEKKIPDPPNRKLVDTYRNKMSSTTYEYVLLGGGGTDAIEHLRDAIERILMFSDEILKQKSSLALPDYLNVMVNLLDIQTNKRPIALFLHLIHSPYDNNKQSWIFDNPVARSVAYPLLGVFLKLQFDKFFGNIMEHWVESLGGGDIFKYIGGPLLIAFVLKQIGILKQTATYAPEFLWNLIYPMATHVIKLIVTYAPTGLVSGAITGIVTVGFLGSFAAAISAMYAVVVTNGATVSVTTMTGTFWATLGMKYSYATSAEQLLQNAICPLIKLVCAGSIQRAYKDLEKSDRRTGYELFMDFDQNERLELKNCGTSRCIHRVCIQDADGRVDEIEVLAKDEDAELAACLMAGNFDHYNECVLMLDRLTATLERVAKDPSQDHGRSNSFFGLSEKINLNHGLSCHGVSFSSLRKAVQSPSDKIAFLLRVKATAYGLLTESKRSLPSSLKLHTRNFHSSNDNDVDTLSVVKSLVKIANSEYVDQKEIEKTNNSIRRDSQIVSLAIDHVSSAPYPAAGAGVSPEAKILKFAESAFLWEAQKSRGEPCIMTRRTMPQIPILRQGHVKTNYSIFATECELSKAEIRVAELTLEEPDLGWTKRLGSGLTSALRYTIAIVLAQSLKNVLGDGVAKFMEYVGSDTKFMRFVGSGGGLTAFVQKMLNVNSKELILTFLGKFWIHALGFDGFVGPGFAHNCVYFASMLIGANKLLNKSGGKFLVDSATEAFLSPWEMLKSFLAEPDDMRSTHKKSLIYRKCLKARFGKPMQRTKRTLEKLLHHFNQEIGGTLEDMDTGLLLQETMVMSKSGLAALPDDCLLIIRRDVQNQLKKNIFSGYPRQVFVEMEMVEYGRKIRPLLKTRATDEFRTDMEYDSAMITKSDLTIALGTRGTLLESCLQRLERVTDSAVAMLNLIVSKNIPVGRSSLVWACQEGGIAALYMGLSYNKIAEYINSDHRKTSKAGPTYWTPYKKALLTSYFKYHQMTPPDFTTSVLLMHMQHVARVLSAACPKNHIPKLFSDMPQVDAAPSFAPLSNGLGTEFWSNARTDDEAVERYAREIADAQGGIHLSEIRLGLEGGGVRSPLMHFYCPSRGVEFCSVLLESLKDVASRLSDCICVSPASSGCYTISQCIKTTGHARHPLVVTMEDLGQDAAVALCNFTPVTPPRTDDDIDGLCEMVRSICFNCERAFYAIKWAYDCGPFNRIILDASGETAHLCTSYALAIAWVGLPTAWSGINLAMSCRTQEELVECKTLLAGVHNVSMRLLRNGINSANVSALATAIFINTKRDRHPQ